MVIIVGVYWLSLIRHTNIETSYQNKCPTQRTHTHSYSFLFKFVSRFYSFCCCCFGCCCVDCLVLSCLVFYISLPCNQFVLISFFSRSSRSRSARLVSLSFNSSNQMDSIPFYCVYTLRTFRWNDNA